MGHRPKIQLTHGLHYTYNGGKIVTLILHECIKFLAELIKFQCQLRPHFEANEQYNQYQ